LKQVLRNPRVQAVLAAILVAYLRFIRRTVGWRHENFAAVEPALSADHGAIALFWHGRIPLCLVMGDVWRARDKRRCMISPSADGAFLSVALEELGYPAIRASSAKKGDSAKARALVAAFREAVNWVSDGGVLVITPDGPRGPNEVIAEGSVQIARRSGAPVYLMGMAASPAVRLKGWDRMQVALPFGRGAMVWDGPCYAPADADEAAVAALAAEWSQRLAAATRRAEAIAEGRAD
jgi:lysophospholipid acyltransferase (LPLAT)-like uncharacterized protein